MCSGSFGWMGNSAGVLEENRAVIRRCQRAMGALLAIYVTAQTILRFRPHAVPMAVAAGIQGAAMFGMFVTLGSIARLRFRGTAVGALNARALLWGLGSTMFLAMVWGFEEVFAPGTVTHLPLLVVPAMVIGLSAIAKLVFMMVPKRTR